MQETNHIATDLAGQLYPHPHYFQIQERINFLLNTYLSFERLYDHLGDLPLQFVNPQPRSWKPIKWQAIDRNQVIGIDLQVFLSIIVGAMNTEAPIRGYTQSSRQYLEKLHPQLARFVGGTVAADGSMLEVGLWEKEERQHSPALIQIYFQLTGEKITPTLRTVRSYQPSADPWVDLSRHGLHRVATEYGATCLYLWLMAHATGTLQVVLEELLLDEINHMTKFWGFGVWAFPDSSLPKIGYTLLQTMKLRPVYSRSRSSLIGTLHRMTEVLSWKSWSMTNKATFIFTCSSALHRLCCWNNSLTPRYLQGLFGVFPNEICSSSVRG